MSNEELRIKINEYCRSQEGCMDCIFNDDDNIIIECLAYSSEADSLKRLTALNRFKKEVLGEEIPYKVKRDNIIDKVIEKFGELQLVKASEECCELAQTLNKYYCIEQTKSASALNGLRTNIIEEIADVEIMIDQVKRLLEINNRDIELIKEDKIERLGDKL